MDENSSPSSSSAWDWETSTEGRDNGLLQAWEVFEQVRLDADLVTLSACETACGQQVAGEGMVGLTRAFQYAGARTVLASLWGVTDDSTAELMDRFYRHLQAGKAKDEALRVAQVELLRAPLEVPAPGGQTRVLDARHPFYWGAFEVIGDWSDPTEISHFAVSVGDDRGAMAVL